MAPPCPLSGASEATLLAEPADYEYATLPDVAFRVWQCGACGHGFLDPLPEPAQLPDIYPATYYTVNPDSPVAFEAGWMRDLKIRRDAERILSLCREGDVKSLVDLGCGDGERLARVGEALGGGLELVGVDFQPDPARVAELAPRGVRLVEANIEDGLPDLADDGHDLVLMSQIIEHVRDPAGVLRSVARKLRSGGRVLIETPNLGGIDFRLFGKRYWGAYHVPRHFHFFTPGSLERACTEAGLRIERRGFLPSGFFIVSLRSALGLSSARRGHRFGEFLNMRNPLAVVLFTGIDQLQIWLGRETSNQFALAAKP